MIIENNEKDNLTKRFVRKEFKCQSCFRFFKKLVQILIEHIQCPFCYSDNCKIINNLNDNNNLESDSSSLRTDYTLKEHEEEEDNKIINKTINTKDGKKNYSFLNKKKLLDNLKPFSVSPFGSSLHRHKFDISEILDDGILTTVTEDFFIDNYCSNFISNFDNPLGRMIFIKMQINNNSNIKSTPSLSSKEIRQIQNFEMSKKFCKPFENDKDEYELPNCIFCLRDILLETNCFLLRCGHLLHDKCLYDWVKEHKICPVCKFPIIQKGFMRKSSLDIIIDDTIKEEEKIKKTFPLSHEDVNDKKEINNNFENDSIDIVKLIDNENNNINIIGEKKNEMELIFDEVKK